MNKKFLVVYNSIDRCSSNRDFPRQSLTSSTTMLEVEFWYFTIIVYLETDLESVKSPHSAKFKHQSSNTIMKVLLLSKWPTYQCLWVVLLLETSAASRFSFVRFLYRFPHFSTTLAIQQWKERHVKTSEIAPNFSISAEKVLIKSLLLLCLVSK